MGESFLEEFGFLLYISNLQMPELLRKEKSNQKPAQLPVKKYTKKPSQENKRTSEGHGHYELGKI